MTYAQDVGRACVSELTKRVTPFAHSMHLTTASCFHAACADCARPQDTCPTLVTLPAVHGTHGSKNSAAHSG